MNSYDDILTENSGQSKAFTAEQKQEWAAQRDSERDYVFCLIRDATEQMTAGNGNLQTYLDVQSRFDKYSVANAILIAVQRPDATKLDDGQGWNEKGVRIRKGEKPLRTSSPVRHPPRLPLRTTACWSARPRLASAAMQPALPSCPSCSAAPPTHSPQPMTL